MVRTARHREGVRKGKSDQQWHKQIQGKGAKGGCADKVNLGIAYAHDENFKRISRTGEGSVLYNLITKR
jgi:hypothetical protein